MDIALSPAIRLFQLPASAHAPGMETAYIIL